MTFDFMKGIKKSEFMMIIVAITATIITTTITMVLKFLYLDCHLLHYNIEIHLITNLEYY